MGQTKDLLQCLACNGTNLQQVLDLGNQPLANSYLTKREESPPESRLVINFCSDCTHCQLAQAVNPDLLYRDYKYVSGTTETLKQHFKDLVKSALNETTGALRVLDIGCNDGSLMEQFAPYVYVLGVDPAVNLREITKQKNLNVLVDYWTSNTAFQISGSMDIICALNCLAHNSNPYDFLKGCTRVLDPYGKLIIEFPYFKETVERNDLGQFYAEHHSYFTAKSFVTLVERVGLFVSGVNYFKDIHGGTLRFILKKGFNPHCDEVRDLIRREKQDNLVGKIMDLQGNIDNLVDRLSDVISGLAGAGYTIIAYGASAKSSTLFNLPNMKQIVKHIEFVIDDNPLKQDLFCPGSNLPICTPEVMKCSARAKIAFLLTVHNFKKEVMSKLRNLGMEGHTLINYVPYFSEETI